MPIFTIDKGRLSSIEQTNFKNEKELQQLIESNLEPVFNCTFVASEFPTGTQHAGRIDSLAISEDNNPVIIEYKKVESSDLINQSLFYLSWMHDHRGDFEIAVQKTLGNNIEVDWSDIRVICIAPNYKKYDLHAVQLMGVNIELWKYRLFKNQTLYLESVYQNGISTGTDSSGKNPIMVAAGKKAAITRATATYTFEEHLEGKSAKIKELVIMIQEFITGLDPQIEQVPKKHYIAYKISQNIICMEIQKQRILLFLKLDYNELKDPPAIVRDVRTIGHFGTGNLEVTINSEEDFELAKKFMELSYQKVGG